MKLYVAESPIKAKSFADALGISNKSNGYFDGGNTVVSWARGHLVELQEPHEYDERYKSFNKADLPIIPDPFQLRINEGAKQQYFILMDLFKKATEIICATDSDREGDLIFHYIHTLSGTNKPYKRILPNDLSPASITKVMAKEIEPRHNVIDSARCRSEGDWLIGMNGSRAATVTSVGNNVISIGRVQTPTLSLVCQAYLANKNFVPTPYYPITITLQKDQISFTARIEEVPKEENQAKAITADLSDKSECIFSERKESKENQPLPYELGSLQIDASKRFGISPKETLDIAQSLYEKHKLITYPRTDSGYITEELFADVPDTIKGLLGIFQNTEFADLFDFSSLPRRCVNDKKAPNHHGIIPTQHTRTYTDLNTKEKQLFDLIAYRYLAAFAPVCLKDKTKYQFTNNSYTFVTTGSVITQPGWRVIFIEPKEDDNDEGSENSQLPEVNESDSLPTSNPRFDKKMTKAPKLYTNASLITAMMSCGKKLDDEQLRKAMQDNELRLGGLATSATRGEIIQKLFDKSFVTNQKNYIVPTDMGLSLYNQIKDLDISKPDLTAKWELKFDEIANGEYSADEFMKHIRDYTRQVTADLLKIGSNIDTDNLKLTCPKCQKGRIIEGKKGFGCHRWKDDTDPCNFVIWKSKSGKTLPLTAVQELATKGRTTNKIKGFKKKEGEDKFDAYLTLNKETWNVDFDFTSTDKSGNELKCPKCGSPVNLNNGGAFCSEKCGFQAWRNMAGKKLSDSQLLSLVTKSKTGLIKGFEKKDKSKKFDAALKLDSEFKVVFDFPAKK